jgi:hypothetical protein
MTHAPSIRASPDGKPRDALKSWGGIAASHRLGEPAGRLLRPERSA